MIIYGKPDCPFCDKAKRFCEEKGLIYTYLLLGKDFSLQELLEKFPGAKSFPQIVNWSGTRIGGYTELAKWFADISTLTADLQEKLFDHERSIH